MPAHVDQLLKAFNEEVYAIRLKTMLCKRMFRSEFIPQVRHRGPCLVEWHVVLVTDRSEHVCFD